MNKRDTWRAAILVMLIITTLTATYAAQLSETFTNWLDHPVINYQGTAAHDAVAQLNEQLQAGQVHLQFDGTSGYLRSVLQALNVPVESQIAVFERDSVQRVRIRQENPRTLFFNEKVAVGWVRGGFVELASQDPQQGVIFYTLEQQLNDAPRFTRHNECLSCHYSYATAGVPGMLVRSARANEVDHRLPLDQRWGGWYVTGSSGRLQHLGNTSLERLFLAPATSDTLNWPSFAGKFDTTGYLSSYSDIVALMVFEHQMHLMNLLSRIGWEARVGAYQQVHGRLSPIFPGEQDDAAIALTAAAEEIVDYMLFVNEAPVPDQIRGSSGFAEAFEALGPRDRRGRSLRQFDLQHRLMRYPWSYMIYAPVFGALPPLAKDAIYRQLWQVLSGTDRQVKYRGLSRRDRQAIVEILRDTKSDVPEYFRSPVQ